MEQNLTKATKQASNSLNQAADSVGEKFKEGAQAVGKKATQLASDIEDTSFSGRYDDLMEKAEDGLDATLSLVKKYPVYSILGAAAVGMLAGAMIKRIGRD